MRLSTSSVSILAPMLRVRSLVSKVPAVCRSGGALAFALAVVGPLALYAWTMPRTVVLEDDGLFLMVGGTLGVAHPPGYPLYTWICHMFMQVPFGTPALLGHLSSAVLGALACGMVYACARQLEASKVPAVIAAWLFGASEHMWSQAIIAEVYTLNAFFFFAVYALLLYAARQPDQGSRTEPLKSSLPQTRGFWFATASVFGLSLANHWPLMVLAAPGLLVAALPAWRAILYRWQWILAGFLLNATWPYAWMVWRSQQDLLINFYGSVRSLQEFWFYIGRQGYSQIDTSPSAGWEDRFQFLQWIGAEFALQLTVPGFILAGLGLWALLRRRQLVAVGSGLLVLVGNSVVLIALLAFEFNQINISIFRPYSLICYGLIALWFAVGVQFILDRTFSPSARWPRAAVPAVALAGAGLVVFSIQAHWRSNDRSEDVFAQEYAREILDNLPENAVLFTLGDADSGPLGYYHFVEKQRPDITLLNTQGLIFGERLYRFRLPRESKKKILREYVQEIQRPVLFTSGPILQELGFGLQHHGFVQELMPDGQRMLIPHQPKGESYFETLLNLDPDDQWEEHRRNQLIQAYGIYMGLVVFAGNSGPLKEMHRSRTLAENNFYSLLRMAEVFLKFGNTSHHAQIEEWFRKAASVQGEAVSLRQQAYFLYLQGFLHYLKNDIETARAFFRKSDAIHPHPDNASIKALRQLDQIR